ncbi:MAG: transcriptional regulator, partial [Xanthobacteraceae bacterium]
MEAGVEMPVETDQSDQTGGGPALQIRLLGPLTVVRGEVAVALPASRKVRALLAYLALAPRAVTRSRLCELLWDVPNDPRGELRWSLNKLRGSLDEPGRRRVETQGDTIKLDLTDCLVDAVEVARAVQAQAGLATMDAERLRTVTALCAGDFLDGLDIDRSPEFYGWLTTQRRHFRGCHAALLERLVKSDPDDENVFGYLESWLRLAPFDRQVHGILLDALVRRGRLREGEEHLAATARLFEAEGLDDSELREIWRISKSSAARPSRLETVAAPPIAEDAAADSGEVRQSARRASIAVMPFVDRSVVTVGERAAEGLVHDVITRLAKLRNLLVIAQGTVFALHERQIGPHEAGRMLNVDYVVSGSVRRQGKQLSVAVELSETRTAHIVWAEVFDRKIDDAFLVLDEIGNNIVASVASEIENEERNRAVLRPPSSLNAWEAHHCGLWHMYRFNKADNERAQHFFTTAVRLDPTFSRAYAGLSFTHWQNAFQGWAKRQPEVDKALETAGQSLMADDRDPAAHWAMGRALWLRGDH